MAEQPRTVQESVLQDSIAQQIISFARICKTLGWTETEIIGVAKDTLCGMSSDVPVIAKAGIGARFPAQEETQWQSPTKFWKMEIRIRSKIIRVTNVVNAGIQADFLPCIRHIWTNGSAVMAG